MPRRPEAVLSTLEWKIVFLARIQHFLIMLLKLHSPRVHALQRGARHLQVGDMPFRRGSAVIVFTPPLGLRENRPDLAMRFHADVLPAFL